MLLLSLGRPSASSAADGTQVLDQVSTARHQRAEVTFTGSFTTHQQAAGGICQLYERM